MATHTAIGRAHALPGGLLYADAGPSPPSIFLPAPAKLSSEPRKKALIFFIPGNPGLAGYYVTFLAHLSVLLSQSSTRTGFAADVFATNLAGFDDADHSAPFRLPHNPPSVVEDQVRFARTRLEEVVAAAGGYDHVFVVGHSVGAYIACEVLHRRRVQAKETGAACSGVLLFPTITDIALSHSGRRLDLLRRRLPLLARYIHVLAALILSLIPAVLLRLILTHLWHMPSHGVATTTAWLSSRDGVRQALHMGLDEMGVIGPEGRWGEGFWDEGKFWVLYGRRDHWVADETRDEFVRRMKARGTTGRTQVIVDKSGRLPHAFCLRHGEEVAEMVARWAEDGLGRVAQ